MKKSERILVAVDFFSPSLGGLHLAAGLAKGLDAELILLSVIEPGVNNYLDPVQVVWSDQEQAHGKLLEAAKAENADMQRTKILVTSGNAVDEILKTAQQHKVGLIVMGTHGRRGLSRVLMGSVAEEVMRQAPCPVLIQKDGVNTQPALHVEAIQRRGTHMTEAEKDWWTGR